MFDIRLITTAICCALISLNLYAAPNKERQAELTHLLKHDCGSCHGMHLKGGLGPALKPDRLTDYSVEALATTILHGRTGTPMPPWAPFLSEQEAQWIAALLKRGVTP
ncbi:MAG: cytochrome c [Candidatus Polarisedimenticolaceae bacterium]|nr:cytochrome c [Candidatus Polarisedimenticolaceae bacterium]